MGGLVEQPRLGAQPAAVRPRRGRQRRRSRPAPAVRRRPRSRASASSPRPRRAASASSAPALAALPVAWSGPLAGARRARGGVVHRELDRRWRRTSYSDITAAPTRRAWRASRRSASSTTSPSPRRAIEPRGLPPCLPLGAIPGGVQFGTFVHAVLEAADFAAADLDAELARARRGGARAPAGRRRRPRRGRRRAAGGARDAARPARRRRAAARRARAPTGSTSSGFELPLAGGDEPVGRVTPGAIGAVLRAHLPPGDPLAATPIGSTIPSCASSVRGYLTGSIDLVLRAGERFAVVDYKTNWLGGARRGAARAALPPGRAGRRDGARALPPAGAALHRRAAPLPALAAARLRPRAPPGRRAVPVRARDDRPDAAVDGSRAACSPGGRRPRWSSRSATCWTAGAVSRARRARRPPRARRARAAARRSTTSACWPPPTCTSRRGSPRSRARPTRRSCWPPRSPSARRGSATCTSTWRRSARPRRSTATSPSTCRRCRGRSREWVARVAASPLVAVGEDAPREPPAAARRHRRSTSTATGARSARSPPTCCALGGRAERSTRRVLADGLDRLFAARGRRDGQQRAAAAPAVRRRFAVVAGGPGTGKTTTVARIVALLAEQAGARIRRSSRWPRRPARRRRGSRRRCTPRRATLDVAPTIRDGLLDAERVDAAPPARLAARQPQPVPPPPRQPAAARRRDRRRDVDGVAVADGAAGRGGAARGAARAGRRPGAADVDRGRRRARGHRRRARARGVAVLEHVYRYGAGIDALAAAIRAGDGDAAIEALTAGHDDVTWIPVDAGDPAALRRARARPRGRGGGRAAR